MTMIRTTFLTLVALTVLSCGTGQKSTEQQPAILDSLKISEGAGEVESEHFVGQLPAADCPGIIYDLTIYHQKYSGDGVYNLKMTYLEAENGKDITFEEQGRQYTLRGDATDPNATVLQLVSFKSPQYPTNFLDLGDSLTMLGAGLTIIDSGLNYTIRKQ